MTTAGALWIYPPWCKPCYLPCSALLSLIYVYCNKQQACWLDQAVLDKSKTIAKSTLWSICIGYREERATRRQGSAKKRANVEDRYRRIENTRDLETGQSDISLHFHDSCSRGNCSYETMDDNIVLQSMQSSAVHFLIWSSIFMEFMHVNLSLLEII
jgi:hypothetical protein